MKSRLILSILLMVSSCPGGEPADSIQKLRAVGREGQGNPEATLAWQNLAKSDASALPEILAGMNGANPLAENWLRAAVDSIADRTQSKGNQLPVSELKSFLNSSKNNAAPRVLAFDLIQQSSPEEAEKLTPLLLDDSSSELRRHPVSKLIEQGDLLLSKDDKAGAKAAFEKALNSARDEDQIKKLSKSLKALGAEVNLVKHFGFLTKWHLVAPFTNVDRKGFDEVFPPEKGVDLSASYKGKSGTIKWTTFTSSDEYGMIDFNKPFGMEKQVTGYAYTEFNVPDARDAEIRLGCKNGWKVWLNGELLFARDEYHRGMKLDQYKLQASLKKGKNALLVKCCQNEQTEQWTVEWQFQLRVCDSTGTAITLAP